MIYERLTLADAVERADDTCALPIYVVYVNVRTTRDDQVPNEGYRNVELEKITRYSRKCSYKKMKDQRKEFMKSIRLSITEALGSSEGEVRIWTRGHLSQCSSSI